MKIRISLFASLLCSSLSLADTVYDGTMSLINGNHVGDSSYGSSKDIAVMHPHKDKNSMVTIQWLYNSVSCDHIDIYTNSGTLGDVIINVKAWDEQTISNSYKVKLPKNKNGISIKKDPNGQWSTVSITSVNPITKPIGIYAYCKKALTPLNTSGLNEISIKENLVDNGYRQSGNSSIIPNAGDNGQKGYGVTHDEAITLSNNDSVVAFQVLSSKNCQEVKIVDKKDGVGITDVTTFEEISVKGWSEPKWVLSSCTTLPCYIDLKFDSDGSSQYTLIKIKTKKGQNNNIFASCKTKDVKFDMREKTTQPKHPKDCKFDDVSTSSDYYDYITALCSAQIIEGYGKKPPGYTASYYEAYSKFGPEIKANWAELTKVVNLAKNFQKTKNFIRSNSKYDNLNENIWYQPYIDLAKQDGFSKLPAQSVNLGMAYRYIIKIFWNEDKTTNQSASFLKDKKIISDTNIGGYLTRKEMAKIVLKSATYSAEESGIIRKLPYINHTDDFKIDGGGKNDIPDSSMQKVDPDDSIKDIEQNRKDAVENDITFSKENHTDNETLTKKMVGIAPKFKDKSTEEIKEELSNEGKLENVDSSTKLKPNNVIFGKDKNGDDFMGVTGEKDKGTGEAKTTIETESGEVNAVSKNDMEKNGLEITGQTSVKNLTKQKTNIAEPTQPTGSLDNTIPTANITSFKFDEIQSFIKVKFKLTDNVQLSKASMYITKKYSGIEYNKMTWNDIDSSNYTKDTSIAVPSNLSNGEYILVVTAEDHSGNVSIDMQNFDIKTIVYNQIINKNSSKCLDASYNEMRNGSMLIQKSCSSGDTTKWNKKQSSPMSSYFIFYNKKAKLYLNQDYNGKAIIYNKKDSDSSLWQLIPKGSGYHHLKSRYDGKCLAVKNASTYNYSGIVLKTCSNNDNSMLWKIQ